MVKLITISLLALSCLGAIAEAAEGGSSDAAPGVCLGRTAASTSEEVQRELELMITEQGFQRPERSAVDAERPWLRGLPNYDLADLEYMRGRSRNHSAGSLASVVENLVKRWEMEASHLSYKDWRTISHEEFRISTNGAPPQAGAVAAERGNYNVLLAGTDPTLYDAKNHTFDSSHFLFGSAFPRGFPWELVEVLTGPPRLVFSWRHWAHFTGEYKGRTGDGKLHELYGIAVAVVNDALKLTAIEVYYKPEDFLRALEGKIDSQALNRGASIFGTGIPVAADSSNGCPITSS